ncbi:MULTISPECIES: hypothetical protein [unclassified Pseudomonas]|jgi:hypothetical protein|uniref:hypothetical protein n=1 Tax=unclassified Pseudomonas TaxID=196821 RepID=UPI0008391E37|nr:MULTISPECIES: hypothetical protein [unclassified Pseudomonas]QIH07371.1 hypothetical protein ATY02_11880 [Pseudomonas sp. BIOMIG1BAC]HBO2935056.1 hypothetical protein [Pseudomonas aeruginosa]
MKLLTFKDTCGKRIDTPAMAPIIKFVAEKVGADPAFILTKSQLDQAMAHLQSTTPDSERSALVESLQALHEKALSSYVSSLNPFAARAVEGVIADVKAGRRPQPARLDHIAELTSHSHWSAFQGTKTLPDTCGQELHPLLAATVRVVSEALAIPESSIRTQSQLSHAMELLRHTCTDEESAEALKHRLRDARVVSLEEVKPLVGGLGQEALNVLTELAKGNTKLDIEQVQRLVMGIRRSMLQDLKREYPDLEQQIAESGDEESKKLLAYLQRS